MKLLGAVTKKQLDKIKIEIDPRIVCTVVAVSGGYPGDYEKGYEVRGLDKINPEDSVLFHMGTAVKDGKILTNGGRIFCITSYGRSVFDAVESQRMK